MNKNKHLSDSLSDHAIVKSLNQESQQQQYQLAPGGSNQDNKSQIADKLALGTIYRDWSRESQDASQLSRLGQNETQAINGNDLTISKIVPLQHSNDKAADRSHLPSWQVNQYVRHRERMQQQITLSEAIELPSRRHVAKNSLL